MNKTVSIIITLGFLVSLGIIFLGGSSSEKEGGGGQNVEVRNGVQYITINAKGGYSPRNSTASAGIPSKLIVKTNGSYDCSSSLSIRSVGFQQVLPLSGETEIDIGVPKAGQPLEGVCSMGMYSFSVNFN